MNRVELTGRLTKEPELKTTGNGVSVCSFILAVNRKYKNPDGNYDADFINCVAWRQSAEFMHKYCDKGSMIGVAGSIQTRNYEKDGQRIYITEVAVDEVEPLSVNRTSNQTMSTAQGMPEDDVDFGAFAPADGDLPY